MSTMKNKRTMRYGGAGIPRKIPTGRVLAHNHVRHAVDMTQGVNGFRWWTWEKGKQPRHFLRCDCGWAGLPHFAHRDHGKHYKCESWEVINTFSARAEKA